MPKCKVIIEVEGKEPEAMEFDEAIVYGRNGDAVRTRRACTGGLMILAAEDFAKRVCEESGHSRSEWPTIVMFAQMKYTMPEIFDKVEEKLKKEVEEEKSNAE